MLITNERVALAGYFITSYPTRAHGIIVIHFDIKTIPLPVLGSLATFVVEIRLGLAAATSLADAVGEPAPDGLAAMSLCRMTG